MVMLELEIDININADITRTLEALHDQVLWEMTWEITIVER